MTRQDEDPAGRPAFGQLAEANSPDGRITDWTREGPYLPILNAPPGRPFVVAQLGQSLDGRIATAAGESQWINGSGALDHLHRLRALADAVIVGAGTVITDNPMLTVRRVTGKSPARVIIDPDGRIPAEARCLASDGSRRIIIAAEKLKQPEGVEVLSLPRKGQQICCREIALTLFGLGLKKLLVEGGAATVSAFIDAGAVDRLHVLAAPLILGSGKMGLELKPIAQLADARRPETRAYQLQGGDVLFDCDLRTEMR